MQPFRQLLAKNAEFTWSDELETAFVTAKKEIVNLVKEGVKSFQLDTHTCITTDWSKTGVGYVMWQKRCQCSTIHPTCCTSGWALIACGSRFCTAAEQRYHPIEGELLAVTWALQKTLNYSLGCEKLLILVDHKPLLGLLQSRNLGEIKPLPPAPGRASAEMEIQYTAHCGCPKLRTGCIFQVPHEASTPGGKYLRGLGRVLTRATPESVKRLYSPT